ncbi:MAG: kinase-like domain-containing protein, partial [Olpidium bornovanus]
QFWTGCKGRRRIFRLPRCDNARSGKRGGGDIVWRSWLVRSARVCPSRGTCFRSAGVAWAPPPPAHSRPGRGPYNHPSTRPEARGERTGSGKEQADWPQNRRAARSSSREAARRGRPGAPASSAGGVGSRGGVWRREEGVPLWERAWPLSTKKKAGRSESKERGRSGKAMSVARYWPSQRLTADVRKNIWHGVDRQTDEEVVMKIIESDATIGRHRSRSDHAGGPGGSGQGGPVEGDEQAVIHEATVLKRLSRGFPQRVLNYRDFYLAGDEYVIVMEKADCTVLDVLLSRKDGKLSEPEAQTVLWAALETVEYIHDERFCHRFARGSFVCGKSGRWFPLASLLLTFRSRFGFRDLKPSNFFLMRKDDLNSLKIGDFGVCAEEIGYNSLKQSAGTLMYAEAPEVLGNQFYGTPCDIWSIGVVAYQLLTGKMPFEPSKMSEKKMARAIKRTDLRALLGRESISPQSQKMPQIRSGETTDLTRVRFRDVAGTHFILSLLDINPANRPTAAKAMEHPWLMWKVEPPAPPLLPPRGAPAEPTPRPPRTPQSASRADSPCRPREASGAAPPLTLDEAEPAPPAAVLQKSRERPRTASRQESQSASRPASPGTPERSQSTYDLAVVPSPAAAEKSPESPRKLHSPARTSSYRGKPPPLPPRKAQSVSKQRDASSVADRGTTATPRASSLCADLPPFRKHRTDDRSGPGELPDGVPALHAGEEVKNRPEGSSSSPGAADAAQLPRSPCLQRLTDQPTRNRTGIECEVTPPPVYDVRVCSPPPLTPMDLLFPSSGVRSPASAFSTSPVSGSSITSSPLAIGSYHAVDGDPSRLASASPDSASAAVPSAAPAASAALQHNYGKSKAGSPALRVRPKREPPMGDEAGGVVFADPTGTTGSDIRRAKPPPGLPNRPGRGTT